MTVRAMVTSKRMNAIKNVADNYESQLKGIVFRAINLVHNEVIQGITEPKSGRVYKRGDKTHTASKAGEYPANDTGMLRRSIKKKMLNDGLQGFVWTDMSYAKALEFGTRTMAPRPFLQPSLEKARPMVKNFLSKVTGAKKG